MMKVLLGLAMALSFVARADGFGSDLLFDNLIAPPNLVARTTCADFGVEKGEIVRLIAQADLFSIQHADGSAVVEVSVPAQGNYVFQGERPNRTANQLQSPALNMQAVMDPATADVTLQSFGNAEHAACRLARCPAFGTCQ